MSFSSRPNNTFQFDKNGDVAGKYDSKSWQRSIAGEFEIITLGQWDPESEVKHLHLIEDVISWATKDGEVPMSLCIEDCKSGYIRVPLEKKCCLGCQQCPE